MKTSELFCDSIYIVLCQCIRLSNLDSMCSSEISSLCLLLCCIGSHDAVCLQYMLLNMCIITLTTIIIQPSDSCLLCLQWMSGMVEHTVNSMDPLKREIRRPTAGYSRDGGISVLYNCLSWYKFVNTDLYHSRQLYNIHLGHIACRASMRSVHMRVSM